MLSASEGKKIRIKKFQSTFQSSQANKSALFLGQLLKKTLCGGKFHEVPIRALGALTSHRSLGMVPFTQNGLNLVLQSTLRRNPRMRSAMSVNIELIVSLYATFTS